MNAFIPRSLAFPTFLLSFLLIYTASFLLSGCASYKGGKIVDGMNLELGMTIPSTELSFNFLSYTSGVVVKGNDETNITITHELVEKNSYFGVVDIEKKSKLAAKIAPTETKNIK